jgi:hypothetical protein
METIKIPIKDYESIKAEWFDENAIIPANVSFYRSDHSSRRLYIVEKQITTENDKIEYEYIPIVSVTSIISACSPVAIGLKIWWQNNDKSYTDWIFKQAAAYGTYIHTVYNKLFLKNPVKFDDSAIKLDMFNFFTKENERKGYEYYNFQDIMKYINLEKRDPKKDIFAIARFIKEREVKPIALEYPLFDADIKSGGVADLICEMKFNKKKVIALIDYKTGKYVAESHGIQLAAYSEMWNKLYPDLKIECIFNFYPTDFKLNSEKIEPYKLTNRTADIDRYLKKWHIYVEEYYLDNTEIQEIKYKDFDPGIEEIFYNTDIDIKEIDVIGKLKDMRENKKVNSEASHE